MRRDVKTYIAACQVCQQMKSSSTLPSGLLLPLPIPEMVFEDIRLDFITCLPGSKGKGTIMIVVDRLSKYGHFIPLEATFSTLSIAEAFVIYVFKLHDPPRTIITNRDPRFLRSFWKELNGLQDTSLAISTTYHPQTDWQSESLNKCVEQYLRCFVAGSPHTWVSILPWEDFWYNTSFQTSAGMTPFQALCGRAPPTVDSYLLGSTTNELVEQFMLRRVEVLALLKHNL